MPADPPLFSVKMRASKQGRHISGAERICPASAIPQVSQALTARALNHPHGEPDDISLRVQQLDAVTRIPALRVQSHNVRSVDDARGFFREFLASRGYSPRALDQLLSVTGLRGAMIVDARTGQRLDPNLERGVRATCMDADTDWSLPELQHGKQHAHEAIVLASKVAHAPRIVAEFCISDDPNYTTGYLATGSVYHRIPHCKDPGSTIGTRVFLYDASHEQLPATIDYIEHTAVLVTGIELGL